MKKSILKITSCVLFVCVYATIHAQTAAPANDDKRTMEIKKATTIADKIATAVKITEEQKTQLQVELQTCFKKFDDARATVHGDDSKIQALKTELQEGLISSIKSVLTPAQYDSVMEQTNNK
jgi:hypothetical protein